MVTAGTASRREDLAIFCAAIRSGKKRSQVLLVAWKMEAIQRAIWWPQAFRETPATDRLRVPAKCNADRGAASKSGSCSPTTLQVHWSSKSFLGDQLFCFLTAGSQQTLPSFIQPRHNIPQSCPPSRRRQATCLDRLPLTIDQFHCYQARWRPGVYIPLRS